MALLRCRLLSLPCTSSCPQSPIYIRYAIKVTLPYRRFASRIAFTPRGSQCELIIETGHLARFADGAVVVSSGNNAVMATAVSSRSPSKSAFLPLTVDFRQSASAIGRIPTNYLRRELGQSDSDILASRIVDRSIRPLFPKFFCNDIQIVCKPLSLDDAGDHVILGLNAASTALAVSPIPWNGPIAAVRVGLIENEIVVNPSKETLKHSALDLIVAGLANREIVMIEMDGREITGEILQRCLNAGLDTIDDITEKINAIRKEAGKEKFEVQADPAMDDAGIAASVCGLAEGRIWFVFTDSRHDKKSRDLAITAIRDDIVETLGESNPEINVTAVNIAFWNLARKIFRDIVLETRVRCDGRSLTGHRPISAQVDLYPRLHGSALFQRGQTQVMGVITFDAPSAAFQPDAVTHLVGTQQKKTFMLHYEFPAFATNEIGSARNLNRRELGHGALAEKALKHVIPAEFPYCIRLACQVLESNGSSSMASVCVGSLALLDAGVPIHSSVAGVAIGLIMGSQRDQYRILTDLIGIEDYHGDMDMKIAGTAKGITAMQLDLKLPGLSLPILMEAIRDGELGIAHVLATMAAVQCEPRSEFKNSVPVLDNLRLVPYKRNVLFRSGAYNAKAVEAETGVKISIEEDGTLSLIAPNAEKLAAAKEMIARIVGEEADIQIDFGTICKAEVVEIQEQGIMVVLRKGMRPIFMHNSSLNARPVSHASALGLKMGDVITVQYQGRDQATGQHRVSRKSLQTAMPVARNMLK